MPALAEAGFRVFSIDLLGYGYSSLAAPHSATSGVAAIHGDFNRFSANIGTNGTKAISINFHLFPTIPCKIRCSKMLHVCPLVSMHFRGSKPDPYGEEGRKINGENGRRSGQMKDMRTRRPMFIDAIYISCHMLSPKFAHSLQPEYDMLSDHH